MLSKEVNFNNMPLSAIIIYQIIQDEERSNTKNLQLKTSYCARTIRYAIQNLLDADLIVRITDITDTRRCYYVIKN